MEKGYCECHGHIMMDGGEYKVSRSVHRIAPCEGAVRKSLGILKETGTVYFRDGGDRYGVSVLAREIAPEYGIKFVSPVFALSKKGRYGSGLGKTFSDMVEYRRLVRELIENGADHLKLIASGIMTFTRCGELSCDSLDLADIREAVSIASGEGLPVMAHVNGADAIAAASEAGAASIEHGYFMDDRVMDILSEKGTVWVPTLAAVEVFTYRAGYDRRIAGITLENQKKALRMAADKGVLIASGSDSGAYGVPHGNGIIKEMTLLKQAGLSDSEIERGNKRLTELFSGRWER